MIVDVERCAPFRLDPGFLEGYRRRPVPWGFGALSWATFHRTYSRDGESWAQACRRVIEGMFTVQKVHCRERSLPFDEAAEQAFAQDAYERLWSFRWTPPGRGLWMMGTRYMYERGGAALNNCGFVSTKDLAQSYAAPFTWLMDMAMLGVGVGFDTRGKGAVEIRRPTRAKDPFVISDSREGWVRALERLLDAYSGRASLPAFWDTSRVRPKGARLESFGGTASGPEPLRETLEDLERLHDAYAGRRADARLIVDTANLVGRCVVAGGIRRAAQIALGDPGDEQFLDLKLDREKLDAYRWASNNSVLAEPGMDYAGAARRSAVNGEPGFFWLGNARRFGRMGDAPDGRDEGALGTNPCVEQTLWDRELCTLVETFPARHDSLEDYLATLRAAFAYAKTVTLVPTHDSATNEVMARNRRVGCSMTGVVQAVERHGREAFLGWCDAGYRLIQELDEGLSRRFRVPRSIKTTTIKPSGTVSLLAGATPGVHWDHAPYYIRRVRAAEDHPLAAMCRDAGYPVEPDRVSKNSVVISFPVHIPELKRGRGEVPLREKVELAAEMQRVWSDNQVSCTADFDPDREAGELPKVLSEYEDRLKALVFLPAERHGYEQPPYETITRERYEELTAGLKPLHGELPHEESLEARYCEGGVCGLEP